MHAWTCNVLYRGWKKTSPIFVTTLNKKWIFCIKAKLLLLKSWRNKKKFHSDSINFKLLSTPSGGFLSICYFYGKTDDTGKISKVSMSLKHVQSPGRINFWVFFYFQMNSGCDFSFAVPFNFIRFLFSILWYYSYT